MPCLTKETRSMRECDQTAADLTGLVRACMTLATIPQDRQSRRRGGGEGSLSCSEVSKPSLNHCYTAKPKPPTAPSPSLEQLVLQRHIRFGLQANTGAKDVGEGTTLLGQGIDNRRTGGRKGSLEHVAQDGENAVERLVFGAV